MSVPLDRKKALIIRFNAIGDIVLTTPVIQALADNNYEVHFLVKAAFAEIVESDAYVTKVWTLKEQLAEVITLLKREDFDLVIDLHNNLRSKRVKSALSKTTCTFSKDRIGYWLLTKLGIHTIQEQHIVERFLSVLAPLGIKVAQPSTRYTIPLDTSLPADLPEKYICIAIGAAWYTKQIPTEKLVNVIEQCNHKNIVLIGGPDDRIAAIEVEARLTHSIINLTGQLTIHQSALVIQRSQVLLAGDTGMMHIAAALDVPVVAVFGSTHPILGYTPYYGKLAKNSYKLIENKSLSCRPCTKQGKDSCPKGHFRCMIDIDPNDIVQAIEKPDLC